MQIIRIDKTQHNKIKAMHNKYNIIKLKLRLCIHANLLESLH